MSRTFDELLWEIASGDGSPEAYKITRDLSPKGIDFILKNWDSTEFKPNENELGKLQRLVDMINSKKMTSNVDKVNSKKMTLDDAIVDELINKYGIISANDYRRLQTDNWENNIDNPAVALINKGSNASNILIKLRNKLEKISGTFNEDMQDLIDDGLEENDLIYQMAADALASSPTGIHNPADYLPAMRVGDAYEKQTVYEDIDDDGDVDKIEIEEKA